MSAVAARADRGWSDEVESMTAADAVAWALDRFHPKIALACSFQKEEAVLLDLVMRVNPQARVFALDTSVLFTETYDLWREIEQRYAIEIEAFRGPTLAEQAAAHGDKLWERAPDRCCALRKVEPLQRALSGLEAWITGIRREQSPTRVAARRLEWDSKHELWKLNPLVDWSERDLWSYISKEGVPYNPLHDRGYASIGCTHCTLPGAGRDGRWAGNDKTECGLHS